jgi:probable HAF family extracellular repeat protein
VCVVTASAQPVFAQTQYTITDLGRLPGGWDSEASGINNSGQVVGFAVNSNWVIRAFLWQSGTGMQDLGTLGGQVSQAFGINDSGQVVGSSDHAFLWQSGTGMQDLNRLIPAGSGWTLLEEATAINDSGCIVGFGLNPAGARDAFLLTPVVPEPSVLAMLLTGGVAGGAWIWRDRRKGQRAK